jgi:hypothetical protein
MTIIDQSYCFLTMNDIAKNEFLESRVVKELTRLFHWRGRHPSVPPACIYTRLRRYVSYFIDRMKEIFEWSIIFCLFSDNRLPSDEVRVLVTFVHNAPIPAPLGEVYAGLQPIGAMRRRSPNHRYVHLIIILNLTYPYDFVTLFLFPYSLIF